MANENTPAGKSDSPGFQQGRQFVQKLMVQVEIEAARLAKMVAGAQTDSDRREANRMLLLAQMIRSLKGLAAPLDQEPGEAVVVTFGCEQEPDSGFTVQLNVEPYLKSLALAGDIQGLAQALDAIGDPDATEEMHLSLLRAIADAGDATAQAFQISALNLGPPNAAERIRITIEDRDVAQLVGFATGWMTREEAQSALRFAELDGIEFQDPAVLAVSRRTRTPPGDWVEQHELEGEREVVYVNRISGVSARAWFPDEDAFRDGRGRLILLGTDPSGLKVEVRSSAQGDWEPIEPGTAPTPPRPRG